MLILSNVMMLIMEQPTKKSTQPALLLERIKSVFPDLSWSDYTYIDEGWDHEVIILDNKLVFRFPDDDEYRALLKNEIRILKDLKPLVEVSIPSYTYISPDGMFAGYPIITGKTLTKQLFDNLQSHEVTVIASQLASLLSTLHTAIADGHDFSLLPVSEMPEWQAETKQLAQKHLQSTLDAEDYTIVQNILNEVDEMIELPQPAVFVHGDIYSRHLLWDQDTKQLGVIDFSDMNIGDPAVDFAELYEYGEPFVKEVYRLYTAPKDATFLARAWIYQRWTAVYMLTDYFQYHKTSFEVARETFDRVKSGM